MNFYWAGAGSFVFFMLIGVLGGSLLHLEGPRWYFFMGLMAALGLSSFALFYYFQRKAQERRGGSSPGNTSPKETRPLIPGPNARLAQSKAGAGIANLPMIF